MRNVGTTGLLSPLVHHSVEVPAVGDALQLVLAGIFEDEARARHEILDGRGDEHLRPIRDRRDPRTDVHRDPADLPVDRLDLTCVQPCADLDPEWANGLDDRLRAFDPTSRPIEGREEAVARRVDLCTTESAELLPDESVVSFQQVLPRPVTERVLRSVDPTM